MEFWKRVRGEHWDRIQEVASIKGISTSKTRLLSDEESGYVLYNKATERARGGEWQDALDYYNSALVLQRRALGKDNLVVAQTLNEIGIALTHVKEPYAAKLAFDEALNIRQEILGPGHEDCVAIINNISKMHDSVRKLSEEGQ